MGKRKGKKKKEISLDDFLQERNEEKEQPSTNIVENNDFSLNDLKSFDESEEGGSYQSRYNSGGGYNRRPLLAAEQVKEPYVVFIGGVSYGATQEDVVNFFAENGVRISNIKLPLDRETGNTRGFGFIQFDQDQVRGAMKLQGRAIMNRPFFFDVVEEERAFSIFQPRGRFFGSRGGYGGGGGGGRGFGRDGGRRDFERRPFRSHDEPPRYDMDVKFKGFGTEKARDPRDFRDRGPPRRDDGYRSRPRDDDRGDRRRYGNDFFNPPQRREDERDSYRRPPNNRRREEPQENIFGGGKHVDHDEEPELDLAFRKRNYDRRGGEDVQGRRRRGEEEPRKNIFGNAKPKEFGEEPEVDLMFKRRRTREDRREPQKNIFGNAKPKDIEYNEEYDEIFDDMKQEKEKEQQQQAEEEQEDQGNDPNDKGEKVQRRDEFRSPRRKEDYHRRDNGYSQKRGDPTRRRNDYSGKRKSDHYRIKRRERESKEKERTQQPTDDDEEDTINNNEKHRNGGGTRRNKNISNERRRRNEKREVYYEKDRERYNSQFNESSGPRMNSKNDKGFEDFQRSIFGSRSSKGGGYSKKKEQKSQENTFAALMD